MEHNYMHGTFVAYCRRGLSWLRTTAVAAAVACGMLVAPSMAEPAWAAEGDGSDMTINLYDYDPDVVNSGHDLKFGTNAQRGNVADGVDHINSWTGSNGGVRQGIVASTVGNDGYPYLASGNNQSLDYLFKNGNGATAYSNVSGLFRLDDDGYYVYDSSENYAYYNGDSGSFVLSDHPRYSEYGDNGSIAPSLPQFLPFNSLTDSQTYYDGDLHLLQQRRVNVGSWLRPQYETQWGYYEGRWWHESDPVTVGYNINGDENYSFGMDFTKTFYMPEDGQVNGSDMIFDFTGDDDVWVFIDDVLVLDLGGIHDAYNGSINFATGTVTVNAKNYGGGQIGEKNIADIFAAAGKTWDGSDYSTHTIKFYYLERGNGGSNCRIRFNMPTVPDGTIEVGKQVTDTNTADFVNAEFTMKVETADSENGPWSTYVGEYKLVDLDGDPIYDEDGAQVTGQTNDDGTFTLKHGQVAQLTGTVRHEGDAEAHKIRANTWYKVTETGADGYSDDYEFDLQDTDLIDVSGDQTDLIGKSKPVRVDRSARMVVRNKFTAKDKYSFTIQKHMEDYSTPDDTFHVKVTDADGSVVTGAQYYVHTIGEGAGETQAMPESGVIGLKADQEIVILDVALGATFKVEEVDEDGSAFTSDEFKDPQYSVQTVDGTTEPSTDPVTVTIEHGDGEKVSYIAHVINAYQVAPVTAPMGTIGITKTLNGLDLDESMFEFKIEAQATGEGDTAVSAEQAADKAGWKSTEIVFTNDGTTAEAGVQSDSIFNFGGDPVSQDRLTFTKDDAGKTYEYVISEVGLNDDYDGAHKTESEYVFDTTQYRIQFVPTIVQEDGADILHLAVYQATRSGSEGAWSDNELIATFDAYGPVRDGGSQVSSRALVPYHKVNFTNSYEPLGLVIQKVDESENPLENACFTLYVDVDKDGEYDAKTDTAVASPVYGTAEMTGDTLTEAGFATKLTGEDPNRAIASFYGLKPGTYFIVETKAPAGYQLAEPATLVIGEDRTFTINGTSIERVENGVATYTITDLAIAKLPTTGSSGTLLMSTVGVATVAVAGCYLALRLKLKR
ncbi:DUF7601 domain-containing protein [Collinsella tanakaei]|uniref:DUF7601 domain-containing protein n=1 Tax=Collinsella tanakaei TaxID=626935 RepID=UPI0025A3DAAB|nr:fibro-slime domain-containing protein [Collinsella tanakaei]